MAIVAVCRLAHSKKDTRYSSDSVDGTSGAGTSESASPEEWKDKTWGGSRTQRRIY